MGIFTLKGYNTAKDRRDVLNEYQDWELVSVDNNVAYFKRLKDKKVITDSKGNVIQEL